MGGGGRYPYPKEVWSPAGGWWTRPKNWKSNTAIQFALLGVATYFTWQVSADKEFRHRAPTGWIPSMLWAKQFRTDQLGIRQEGTPSGDKHDSH